jgi:serine/threonine-protein kinase RsbW
VRELRHAATVFAENGGFSGAGLDAVRACVSEAVINAVVHAFAGRATGMVTVTAEPDTDQHLLRVRDDDAGFRPRTDSAGMGLGIPTIAALADSTSVGVSDTGGTELCMAFARERSPEPAIHG